MERGDTCPVSVSIYPCVGEDNCAQYIEPPLIATIPVTEYIKDKLDSRGDSQLLEDSVDVVPDRMFLNLKPLSDFAVLQAVGDEADHIFFTTRQQGNSVGII